MTGTERKERSGKLRHDTIKSLIELAKYFDSSPELQITLNSLRSPSYFDSDPEVSYSPVPKNLEPIDQVRGHIQVLARIVTLLKQKMLHPVAEQVQCDIDDIDAALNEDNNSTTPTGK
jgi:hypothetical protein